MEELYKEFKSRMRKHYQVSNSADINKGLDIAVTEAYNMFVEDGS